MSTLGVWIAIAAATATVSTRPPSAVSAVASHAEPDPGSSAEAEPSETTVQDAGAVEPEGTDASPEADEAGEAGEAGEPGEPDSADAPREGSDVSASTSTAEAQEIPAPEAEEAPVPEAAPPPRLDAPPPAVLPPFHPLRIRWGITAPVIGTTALGFVVMEGLGATGSAPMVCTPPVSGTCPDLGRLEPIDRVAVGHYNGAASKASDAFVAAALLGPALASMAEAIVWARADRERGAPHPGRRGAARFGYHSAIWVESIGVAMFTTNVLKAAFGRPRPLTHLGEAALLEEGLEPEDIDGDFGRSFPSGHATLAFSSVVAGATLLTLEQCRPTDQRRLSGTRRCAPRTRRQRTMLGLLWGLGTAGAATTAVLRVVAGKHYPTDVLMGSAIGATSGLIIPLLHRRRGH